MNDCIVNVGFGGWHPKGSARLERSLIYHGFEGHIQTWTNGLPPDCPPHDHTPYGMKVKAIEWAINEGYDRIMWLDSSVWAIRYPKNHFDAIAQQGYYMVDSGWVCDQWTNDNCLNYFGLTRDKAGDIPMISAGILGLSMRHEIAREFFAQWKNAMNAGAFRGSWTADPNEGSGDRYRGHRHDQSCASIIAHRLGMVAYPRDLYDMYKYREMEMMPEPVEFALAGL